MIGMAKVENKIIFANFFETRFKFFWNKIESLAAGYKNSLPDPGCLVCNNAIISLKGITERNRFLQTIKDAAARLNKGNIIKFLSRLDDKFKVGFSAAKHTVRPVIQSQNPEPVGLLIAFYRYLIIKDNVGIARKIILTNPFADKACMPPLLTSCSLKTIQTGTMSVNTYTSVAAQIIAAMIGHTGG